MFTNSQLDTLIGILERRCDPKVTEAEYNDMLRMAKSEQSTRNLGRERLKRVRENPVDVGSIVPDPFNDPSNW
tara:strand:+ start:264 stop:482 length:219 start_codon:yes stop_codon:yes gene_type:complete